MLVVVAGSMLAPLAAPQSPPDGASLRLEVEALREEVRELRKRVEELRARQPDASAPSSRVQATVGGGQQAGRADATVAIIEFSDYQCPFCQRYASTTFPVLKRDYVDAGKVRYVLRDFPLDAIHPDARKAAEAAHCAGDQGRYWEMHGALFGNPRLLKRDHLQERARTLLLDEALFAACLDSGKHAATVEQGYLAGKALGVTATPSFFIGRIAADGTIDAVPLRGSQPTAVFRRTIDALLQAKRAE